MNVVVIVPMHNARWIEFLRSAFDGTTVQFVTTEQAGIRETPDDQDVLTAPNVYALVYAKAKAIFDARPADGPYADALVLALENAPCVIRIEPETQTAPETEKEEDASDAPAPSPASTLVTGMAYVACKLHPCGTRNYIEVLVPPTPDPATAEIDMRHYTALITKLREGF